MSYIGSWKIDDNLTFYANTHTPSTGAAVDADSDPAYRVYEDETGTPLLTGSMAKLDDAGTVGFYSEQITLSAANGFEKGKSYAVRIAAAVSSVTGVTIHNFQLEAEVDANVVSDKTGYALTSAYDPAKTTAQDSDLDLVVAQTNKVTFDSDNYILSHPMTSVTVGTNSDKTGYSLTSAYDPAKTAAQDSDLDVVGTNVSAIKTQTDKMTFDSDLYIVADARKISTSTAAADGVESNIAFLDLAITDVPTATENADALLKRDWTAVTGEAARSVLNALRFIRNKFSTTASAGFVTVYKEDDATAAYTKALTTDSDAAPIVVG